jgi:hypothetical protein
MLLSLVGDILFGVPVTLTKQTLGGLRDIIDKERLITEDSIKERLQSLQIQLQDGELSEEEYQLLEDQLIERLRAVREYADQRGE